jgi:hypothetical protein
LNLTRTCDPFAILSSGTQKVEILFRFYKN